MDNVLIEITEAPVAVSVAIIETAIEVSVAVSEVGTQGTAWIMATGAKYSATHAGMLHETSCDDDYMYICVVAGTAGNAIWKKTPLFKSN